jgi:hypothetical protein
MVTKKKTPKKRATTRNNRLLQIEKRVGVPHEIQDLIERLHAKGQAPQTTAARVLKSFPALANDQSIPVQLVDVEFDLDHQATTAVNVRVYLPGHAEDIASSAAPHGVLPRQVVGSTVVVVMDVTGNPNHVGVFTVRHAQPPKISLKVSDGPVSLKSLFVG